MTAILAIEGVALVFLFVCSAFFSSAETAFFSLDSIHVNRIRRKRPATGKRIAGLLESPNKLLSSILIGNTLVNVAAASLGYAIADHLVPDAYTEAVAIPAMVLFLLLFGEVAPKRIAIRHPERMAIAYAPLLDIHIKIVTPIRAILDAIAKLFKQDIEEREEQALTEDEFLTAVEVSEEEGVLDEDEKDMVDGIIRLEDTQASDVMTPRVDLVGIDLDDDPSTYDAVVAGCSFRFLPVYRETMDTIEHLLNVSAYLLDPNKDFSAALKKPFFVPETAPLDTLLATFQREKRRVAIVADEYGGTAGLITRGDVLEEIIEYAGDEREEEKLTIERVGPEQWLIDGSTSLEEINYELDLELEAEGADRIAGWVNTIAEHIPKPGEIVQAQGCRITVNRIRKNRITLVHLEKIEVKNSEEEDD